MKRNPALALGLLLVGAVIVLSLAAAAIDVADASKLDKATVYKAVVTALPLPPMPVLFEGDAAGVAMVAIRLATGSATVATVTAAGLMAPIVTHMNGVSMPLLALAIGAGSLFFSHVNDAGFWLVKEYFGMSVGQTVATWSAMETILSVVGIVLILLLSLVICPGPAPAGPAQPSRAGSA